MDSSTLGPTPKKLEPPLGGLKHLERLLGFLRDQVVSNDAVFVSLDLEAALDRKTLGMSGDKPAVTQLGFAYLDTRDIQNLSSSSNMRSLISVRAFKVVGLSLFKTAQSKSGKQCIFAKSQHIKQKGVPAAIMRNLRIYDKSSKEKSLRNIILVGQSIKEDLKIIRLLDVTIFDIAPVLTAIDTHLIARYILPPYSPNTALQPGKNLLYEEFCLRLVVSSTHQRSIMLAMMPYILSMQCFS